MGKEKTTQQTDTNTKTTYTPTPEETELNKLDLELRKQTQPGLMQTQTQGLNLINALLSGQALPGYLQGLPGGISAQVTSDIAREAVKDIMPSFQSSGIIDSGVAAESASRVAGDVRRASAEFNIGNLLNLLNLAVGGQAQIQSPALGVGTAVGQRLAGLRTATSTGGSMVTTLGMNPFWKSFQTSLGSTLGGPKLTVPFGSGGSFGF